MIVKVGDEVRAFTKFMFGVTPRGRVLKIKGDRVQIEFRGGGSVWKEWVLLVDVCAVNGVWRD